MDETSGVSKEAERQVTRLWHTWKTVHSMLSDRVRSPDCERSMTDPMLKFPTDLISPHRDMRFPKKSWEFHWQTLPQNTRIPWGSLSMHKPLNNAAYKTNAFFLNTDEAA